MHLRRNSWLSSHQTETIAFDGRDRLRAATAILDGVCLSVLLWLVILAVIR